MSYVHRDQLMFGSSTLKRDGELQFVITRGTGTLCICLYFSHDFLRGLLRIYKENHVDVT